MLNKTIISNINLILLTLLAPPDGVDVGLGVSKTKIAAILVKVCTMGFENSRTPLTMCFSVFADD